MEEAGGWSEKSGRLSRLATAQQVKWPHLAATRETETQVIVRRMSTCAVATLTAASMLAASTSAAELGVVGFGEVWVVPRAGTLRCDGLLGIQNATSPVWTCLDWSTATSRFEVQSWGRVEGIAGSVPIAGITRPDRAYFLRTGSVSTLDLESMQVLGTTALASVAGEVLSGALLIDVDGDATPEVLVSHGSYDAIHSLATGAILARLPDELHGPLKSAAPVDAAVGDELVIHGQPYRVLDPITFAPRLPDRPYYATVPRFLQLDADPELETLVARLASPVGPTYNIFLGVGPPGSESTIPLPFEGGLAWGAMRAPWSATPAVVAVFGQRVVTIDVPSLTVTRDETREASAPGQFVGSATFDVDGDAGRELVWWEGTTTTVYRRDALPAPVQRADGAFRLLHRSGPNLTTLETRGSFEASYPQLRNRRAADLVPTSDSWQFALSNCPAIADLQADAVVGVLSACSNSVAYRSADGIGQWNLLNRRFASTGNGVAFAIHVPTSSDQAPVIEARNLRTGDTIWMRALTSGATPNASAAADVDADGDPELYVAFQESLQSVVRRYDGPTSVAVDVLRTPGDIVELAIIDGERVLVKADGSVALWDDAGIVTERQLGLESNAEHVIARGIDTDGRPRWLFCAQHCLQLESDLGGDVQTFAYPDATAAVLDGDAWIISTQVGIFRVDAELAPLLRDGFE